MSNCTENVKILDFLAYSLPSHIYAHDNSNEHIARQAAVHVFGSIVLLTHVGSRIKHQCKTAFKYSI